MGNLAAGVLLAAAENRIGVDPAKAGPPGREGNGRVVEGRPLATTPG